ncbi:hypothetical protein BJ546DRAFT_293308 [Cryomyces antarcticus]
MPRPTQTQPQAGSICTNLAQLRAAPSRLNSRDGDLFARDSDAVLKKVTDKTALHCYHVEGDVPDLLLIGVVYEELHGTKARFGHTSSGRWVDVYAVIIVHQANEGYSKVVATLELRSGKKGREVLEGHAQVFPNIVVVKGGPIYPTDYHLLLRYQSHMHSVARRVLKAIERTLRRTGGEKVVWHNTHSVELLSFFSTEMWNRLQAIVCTNALKVDDNAVSLVNRRDDLIWGEHVLRAEQFNIPVLYVHESCSGVENLPNLRQFKGFAGAWPAMLPPPGYRALLQWTFGHLAQLIFQSVAVVDHCYRGECVRRARALLTQYESAQYWAKRILEEDLYSRETCRRVLASRKLELLGGLDGSISCPIDALPDKLANLLIGPGRPTNHLTAARVDVNHNRGTLKVSPSRRVATFVLVGPFRPASQEEVRAVFWARWDNFVKLIRERNPPPTLSRLIASAWKDWCDAMQSVVFHIGDELPDRREQLEKCMKAIEDGSMTRICRRTLRAPA